VPLLPARTGFRRPLLTAPCLVLRQTCGVSREPRRRIEFKRVYEELASPVEGELRRERIADADAPCPRCGAREWLLIERRAEPDEPFTRWRALACASCGAADGWESAGRTRRGRTAERWEDWDAETVPRMPDEPTAADVCRLASFRVLSPSGSPELRKFSYRARKLTGVTLAAGPVEVTTEIAMRLLYSVPTGLEPPPERRARDRLAQLVHEGHLAQRAAGGGPARALASAAAWRQASLLADDAEARATTIDVDGAPVEFTLVEHESRWAAVADLDDESVTFTGRDVPAGEAALQTVSRG
jgi:hypothetical protein